ncbi:uncharacterized protein LOC124806282 [Hydra vulgaris]|uniref:uncharacterized protein LOC124806282 n=1 Tax=Hydra vulgaris TaxID=6087 RepID=UPI0001923E1D
METSAHEVLVFKWFNRGYNFFITGGAGCGKSYLLNKLANSEQLYKKIEITASTGTAAHLIGGMTLHSFAGIGVGRNKCEFYLKHMKPEVKERWLNTDVLIIDEISMINAKTFDLLHDLACKIRFENEELFGGMQIIVCGDMLQLKPIEGDYIFKSEIWKKYMQRSVVLTKCFRQKEDPLFFNALNEIRLGKVNDASIEYLTKRHFTNDQLIDKSYPRLFFLRGNVFKYNEYKMSELKGKATCFKAKDKILDKNITVNSFQIPTEVTVKLGAVVMLLKNINVEEGLCNGAVGVVTHVGLNSVNVLFKDNEIVIEIMKEDILDSKNKIIASRNGLPLQLAFAITVHKAQGSPLKKLVVDFSHSAFDPSLYYVSLSRVCSLEDLYMIHPDVKMLKNILKCITANPEVLNFYEQLKIK